MCPGHPAQPSLTHGHQVAVVLQCDISVEVPLSGVQLLPLLQGKVHEYVPEGQGFLQRHILYEPGVLGSGSGTLCPIHSLPHMAEIQSGAHPRRPQTVEDRLAYRRWKVTCPGSKSKERGMKMHVFCILHPRFSTRHCTAFLDTTVPCCSLPNLRPCSVGNASVTYIILNFIKKQKRW